MGKGGITGSTGKVVPLLVKGRTDGGAVDTAFSVLGSDGRQFLVGVVDHAVHGDAAGADDGSGASFMEVVEQSKSQVSRSVGLAKELGPKGRFERVADEFGAMWDGDW